MNAKVVLRACIADLELRLFQYTAIDEFTRSFLAADPEQSAYASADFLKKLVKWHARQGIKTAHLHLSCPALRRTGQAGRKRLVIWQNIEAEAQEILKGAPFTYKKTITITDKSRDIKPPAVQQSRKSCQKHKVIILILKSLKHTNTEKKMTKNIPAEFLWRRSRKMDII